ncbi:bifunctional GNAT family N-acetyltransferase/(deoxy)nucleoside triphosphate pyrophosphohydrolase [Plastoroseomonas arctica]|uniref:8-oxo-dGTP diphosphatase n=1 Tax=Plastoroseomonas arctica TaxID=1509237 RepID=A0AAF1KU75_9PROT|nr:bifunctional GNAT family N-acetyltransferase/(deoxy)nucleoside triphosphate pyrophosphohydrolase [Plastoroseomonas arctica]MBR0655647.1 GNAT family N-acetyltransferase [Plastoroseomonas arctica]
MPDPRPPTPGFEPLRTERFRLRALRAEDAPDLHRLVNDWDVAKMLARVPFPYPRPLADEFIASTHVSMAAGSAWHLAITGQEGESEVLVGCVGITRDPESRAAELGYWIGRRFWGHGAASEAAGRLLRWSLANLPIDRVVASALLENAASQAVLRRIGFRESGMGEREFVSLGGARPVRLFEARREDVGAPALAASGQKPILLVAACALIDADGRVLLARRPEGKAMAGLWEFPGGKLHAGETPEDALIRELHEELGIEVQTACLAPFAFASHADAAFHLLMPLYVCRRWTGRPQGREGQALAWVRPEKLSTYPMPPADVPLVALLRDLL